jgi:hypothetical protein
MSGLRVSAPVASLAPMDIGHLACQRESAHGEQLVVSAYSTKTHKQTTVVGFLPPPGSAWQAPVPRNHSLASVAHE